MNPPIPRQCRRVVIQQAHDAVLLHHHFRGILHQLKITPRIHAVGPLGAALAPRQRIPKRVDEVNTDAGHHRAVVGGQTASGHQLAQTDPLWKEETRVVVVIKGIL